MTIACSTVTSCQFAITAETAVTVVAVALSCVCVGGVGDDGALAAEDDVPPPQAVRARTDIRDTIRKSCLFFLMSDLYDSLSCNRRISMSITSDRRPVLRHPDYPHSG
jgi:hypothetical protein